MDPAAEVTRLVVAIVTSFETAADALEDFRERKKQLEPKRERDVEQLLEIRVLLRSLLEGGGQCRQHCDRNRRQFGQAFENGDIYAQACLKDVVILLQTEVVPVLLRARTEANPVLDLVELHESSVRSRKDAISAMSQLCQRITTNGHQRPVSEGRSRETWLSSETSASSTMSQYEPQGPYDRVHGEHRPSDSILHSQSHFPNTIHSSHMSYHPADLQPSFESLRPDKASSNSFPLQPSSTLPPLEAKTSAPQLFRRSSDGSTQLSSGYDTDERSTYISCSPMSSRAELPGSWPDFPSRSNSQSGHLASHEMVTRKQREPFSPLDVLLEQTDKSISAERTLASQEPSTEESPSLASSQTNSLTVSDFAKLFPRVDGMLSNQDKGTKRSNMDSAIPAPLSLRPKRPDRNVRFQVESQSRSSSPTLGVSTPQQSFRKPAIDPDTRPPLTNSNSDFIGVIPEVHRTQTTDSTENVAVWLSSESEKSDDFDPEEAQFLEKLRPLPDRENPKIRASFTAADYQDRLSALSGQESVWLPLARPAMHNRYHGFCKGAWEIRRSVEEGLLVEVTPSAKEPILHWRCTSCNFQSRAPDADALPDIVLFQHRYNIRYRWIFLAKSHQKAEFSSATPEHYSYGCIFCAAQGRPTAPHARLEHLFVHILSKHRTAMMTPEVKAKTRCEVVTEGAAFGDDRDDGGGGKGNGKGKTWDIRLQENGKKVSSAATATAAQELFIEAGKFWERKKRGVRRALA